MLHPQDMRRSGSTKLLTHFLNKVPRGPRRYEATSIPKTSSAEARRSSFALSGNLLMTPLVRPFVALPRRASPR